jgi:3-deoxy-manno-octulosonate cytidylyltransferase (CMP-KDO synthetase)
MFRVVVPARFASTRLPGKPLALLAGKPLVLHVHALALRSGALEVVVATDDARIRDACVSADADVELTDASHPSGTDRIAEVAARRGWAPDSIVVNVQGDEPLLPPALIAQAASLLESDRGAAIATLATPIATSGEFRDPNVVKVVASRNGRALYFSRAPIPWERDDGAPVPRGARRHLGIYAYRVEALRQLSQAPPSPLELVERLEQLRALQLGLVIAVADACEAPGPGIDTPEDLERAETLIQKATRA